MNRKVKKSVRMYILGFPLVRRTTNFTVEYSVFEDVVLRQEVTKDSEKDARPLICYIR